MNLKDEVYDLLMKEDVAESLFYEDNYDSLTKEFETNRDIAVSVVDNYADGHDYWYVYKFSRDLDEVYVKFRGHYESYAGTEYEDFIFVEPQEVTIIQYVATEGVVK